MAAKGYFDALVKLGELASDSQGSKELGECAIKKYRVRKVKMAPNEEKRGDLTAGENLQMVCCMCWRGKAMKTRGMRKCRERGGERERTEGKGREKGHCWEINNTT